MIVEITTLENEALDWAVALAEGLHPILVPLYQYLGTNKERIVGYAVKAKSKHENVDRFELPVYDPSSNWDIGGPIILREKISLIYFHGIEAWRTSIFTPSREQSLTETHPDAPLTAAMRCYARLMLGETIEVPDELLENLDSEGWGVNKPDPINL